MVGRVVGNMIEVRQGDSFVLNIALSRDGQPVDLSGAKLKMQVRDNSGNLLLTVNGSDVDVVDGKMAVELTPEQTKIPVGDYKTDIQLTTANGAVHTLFPGQVGKIGVFRITEQVTE